jgi:aspartate-semialdehyde dehydrogenase
MDLLFLVILLLSSLFYASAFRNPIWSRKTFENLKQSSIKAATNLSPKVKVGIVGATGAVGEEILTVMEQRKFEAGVVKLFASEKSSGKTIQTSFYGDITLEAFDFEEASKLDVVFLAVGGDFSLEWAEKLANAGVLVIDNSSAFRYRDDIPLVVPEINIKVAKGKKLIANPNCTTAIALMALFPIHQRFKIKKAIISTYQAASGAGAPGMQELKDGIKETVEGKTPSNKVFAHPLPYNLIPHIDVFQPNKYTKEEMKVTWETKKIMEDPNIKVSCTAVRIPTLRAHAESITLETEEKITADEVRAILAKTPGVQVVDEPENKKYPMPLNASKKWDVEVGRIRENDVFGEYGLDLFVCGDQVNVFIFTHIIPYFILICM